MSPDTELPLWAAIVTAVLVLLGASLALIGTVGLLRLKTFYERVHAPTLGTTLGIGCILIGSMVYFTVLETRPVLHELLIAFYMTLTTPITLVMLVRAALYRDRYHGRNQVPDSDPPKSTLIDKDRGRD